MAIRITRYEETPNPNALKCWLNRSLSEAPRSFLNSRMASDDPLASALFADAPITTILINGEWMTINKRPDAEWAVVKERIERTLAGCGEGKER